MEEPRTPSKTSKKSFVRIAAILFWLVLVVQHIFAEKISEPYPSVQFPGFNEIPSVQGKLSYTKLECIGHWEDGTKKKLDKDIVFGAIPKGFHNYVLSIIQKRKKNGLNLLTKTMTPGTFTVTIEKSWSQERMRQSFADMQKWFGKNVSDGFPEEPIKNISFGKTFYSYDTETASITKDSVQENAVDIDLL